MKSVSLFALSALALAVAAAFALPAAARASAGVAAGSSAVAAAPVAQRRQPLLYALVVSFNSLGAGVSQPHYSSFRTQLGELEAEWGPIERHIVYWGREGEFDVCLPLWEVPQPQRHNFIQDVRDNLEPSGRAYISEQATCGH